MALVDGQLLPAVCRTVRPKTLTFDLTPYRPLRKAELAAITAAAKCYGDFLGLPAELRSP